MSKTAKEWIERNEESLRAEYRAYAIRHDYDPDGVMPFEAWAEREWFVEMELRRQEVLSAAGAT